MINYSIVMRHNPLDKTQPKKAYAVAQSRETMDLSSFAKHISDHGCAYSRADISCDLPGVHKSCPCFDVCDEYDFFKE